MSDFWEKCAEHGVAVVAVKLYSGYDDKGSMDESKFIGTKYAVIDFDNEVVAGDYQDCRPGEFFQCYIEDYCNGYAADFFDTPEAALSSQIAIPDKR